MNLKECPQLEDLLNFLILAGKLKKLPRTGWLESGIKDPESVADHSFRTALIGLLISDLEGLDSEKVTRMALIHDLAEVKIGDLTPMQKKAEHNVSEDEAMKSLFSMLPMSIAEKLRIAWNELLKGASPEAKIVDQADKIEMLLQAMEYENEGIEPNKLDHFWQIELAEGLPLKILQKIRNMRTPKTS
jgi:putative hydrolase of HD superfamily